MLVGCKSSSKDKEKTFSGSGLTITLNNTFFEKEVIQAQLYLESTDHIFMSLRETKTDLSNFQITTLDAYIKAVLNNANKTATVQTYEKDGISYKYAYFTSTVGEQKFGYMMLAQEGKDHFYSMNFGCLEKKLEDNKDLYTKWAKTIKVE